MSSIKKSHIITAVIVLIICATTLPSCDQDPDRSEETTVQQVQKKEPIKERPPESRCPNKTGA